MGPHIPKNLYICLFCGAQNIRYFSLKKIQICSARRLLHEDIYFKNI
jgi:hypothetical protein